MNFSQIIYIVAKIRQNMVVAILMIILTHQPSVKRFRKNQTVKRHFVTLQKICNRLSNIMPIFNAINVKFA